MKKTIIALLMLTISCGGFTPKKDDPLKDPFILYYLFDNFIGIKNSAIIDSVEINLARLTSPIYQIESKGLDSPEAISYNSNGSFHSIDPVNATADVGKALYYLGKKYASSPTTSDLTKIEGYLSYIERMQADLSGGVGRGYVLTSVYNQFPSCSQDLNNTGNCGAVRYKAATIINGNSYRLRYDIDPGSVSNLIVGLGWVYRNVSPVRARVKTITTSLRNWYIANSYLIKDGNGITTTYGNHSRSNNPLSMLNDNILLYIVINSVGSYSDITGITAEANLDTYDFGGYTDKKTYNSYAITKNLEFVNTFASNSVTFVQYKSLLTTKITLLSSSNDHVKAIGGTSIKSSKDFPIQKGHCIAESTISGSTSIVAFANRIGYDKWENSYSSCTTRTVSDMNTNLDFLQAYWSF